MKLNRLATLPFPLRIAAFLTGLALIWLPLAGAIFWGSSDTATTSILLMLWLLLAFIGALLLWGRWLYGCSNILSLYGLDCTQTQLQTLAYGLATGILGIFVLVVIQISLKWVVWSGGDSVYRIIAIGSEGLAVAIAIGFGEELVFRGWLLDELERDYSSTRALWASSLIFAALHFIKPWDEIIRTLPQFPGLVILGLLLVWAKRSQHGQLGLAIGIHAGLVWGYYLVQVGQLVEYQSTAPSQWSGIDQNPLAGGLGLLLLSTWAAIARWMAQRSRSSSA